MVWLSMPPEPRPPVRNSQGTKGRSIRLKANYFPVQVKNKNIELIHYDVVITEAGGKEVKIPKAKRMRIFEAMKEQHPNVFGQLYLGFDSEKNAYSVSSFNQIKKGFKHKVTLKNQNTDRVDEYNVSLTVVNHAYLQELLAALRDTSGTSVFPQTIFQMLEVLFHHTPSVKYICIGRNTFFSCGGEFGPLTPLGGGKEGVVGFFSSLRPCAWKDGSMLLNLDISNKAFYKEQTVLEFMTEIGFTPRDFNYPLDDGQRRKLAKELKGLQVEVTHTEKCRRYKVQDVSQYGADRQTFPLTDPNTQKTTNCTVQKYFAMQYNKRLQYPALNCLKVGPQSRNIHLPIEFCRIHKGQKDKRKLTDAELAVLIKSTAKPPRERLQNICNVRKEVDFNIDPIIKSLEFTVADEPVTLDGRVLPPPSLTMNEELKPRDGVWDSRNRQFFNGAQVNTWVVMNYDPKFIREDMLWNFLTSMMKMGKERGMSIQEPVVRYSFRPDPEREFPEIKQKIPNIQMILVVLPKFGNFYARIKKTGDRDIQVVTQCIKSTNVRACAPPTVGNILLKINAKMGGTNNVLSNISQPIVFTTPVMIMGADVNHPQAGDKVTPSLAAVLGSLDRYASKYAVEVRHQMHRTEMIQKIREMTKNLLKAFYRFTKRKPERIVMYRDGVSESQFLEVLSFELKEMRKACTELQADYQPAITFIVVQKRHHTRLFCQERDGVGRSKNIPPGTTVDKSITHPTERDFYLCSHQGIQGTSKPTHYHCLWDDSDLNMDQLEELTYAMCHLYSRCTRSVSIPAPAYYAHLAAFRAKVHIQDLCQSDTVSLTSSSSGADAPSDAVLARACQVEFGNEIFSKLYYV
ncbi:protein argonaute-2-like [Macrobrachium nipponense]|uniref:protein argonaute-2-like n=1 Tax=Macrobrachium nipponense TaxID=159736 RepID=UPI0030C86155